MTGARTEPEAPSLLDVVGAVSLLISRCLGSCRCLVEGGWCGLHRLEPVVDTAQGPEMWTVELAAAALVAAGSSASSSVRRRWAEDLMVGVLDPADPEAAFRLGYRGSL